MIILVTPRVAMIEAALQTIWGSRKYEHRNERFPYLQLQSVMDEMIVLDNEPAIRTVYLHLNEVAMALIQRPKEDKHSHLAPSL